MLHFESLNKKEIKVIKKNADSQVYELGKASSSDYTYIFVKESVICTFMLVPEAKEFKSPLLKSYYYLSVTFIGTGEENKITVQPFNSEHAKKIVKKFFPETESVWEHAPFTDKGATAQTHHFYKFVSIPYGKKIVRLQLQDMQELVNKYFVLYEQGEK